MPTSHIMKHLNRGQKLASDCHNASTDTDTTFKDTVSPLQTVSAPTPTTDNCDSGSSNGKTSTLHSLKAMTSSVISANNINLPSIKPHHILKASGCSRAVKSTRSLLSNHLHTNSTLPNKAYDTLNDNYEDDDVTNKSQHDSFSNDIDEYDLKDMNNDHTVQFEKAVPVKTKNQQQQQQHTRHHRRRTDGDTFTADMGLDDKSLHASQSSVPPKNTTLHRQKDDLLALSPKSTSSIITTEKASLASALPTTPPLTPRRGSLNSTITSTTRRIREQTRSSVSAILPVKSSFSTLTKGGKNFSCRDNGCDDKKDDGINFQVDSTTLVSDRPSTPSSAKALHSTPVSPFVIDPTPGCDTIWIESPTFRKHLELNILFLDPFTQEAFSITPALSDVSMSSSSSISLSSKNSQHSQYDSASKHKDRSKHSRNSMRHQRRPSSNTLSSTGHSRKSCDCKEGGVVVK